MVKKIINLAQIKIPKPRHCSAAIVLLFLFPSIVSLLPAPLSQALVWLEEKQANAAIINLSGSCKRVNQVTDCSDTGTVRFAVNGVLQPQTQIVVGGTWIISGADVLNGDVITIFIDGASNIREAVAVTRYDGTGNITGIELLEKHLSIGSDDNQTISNNDLSLYDSSASGDEDIFYDVSNANDLTVDIFGAYTTEKLYIKSGNTFQPDSTGSGAVNSQDIEINGTFIADSNSINLNGYWTNNSIFTAGTSTVTFTAGSGTERIDSVSASVSDFYNLSFNDLGGSATYQLESDLSVLNDLSVIDGLLNTKSGSNYAVNIGRDWLQTGGRVEARLSTLTVARHFVADGSEINDGYNDAHLIMTGTGSLAYNNLSSPWSRGFRYLTVGQSGNVTTLNRTLAVIRQLVVGSGSLNSSSENVFLLGIPSPLVVQTNSTIDINQLRFFGVGIQELPPLSNGYDSHIQLARGGAIVDQAGHITINSSNGLILDGDGFGDLAVTYNTNGFDLTVGGNIQIGAGNDTALKRLDITNSTVTVGGNIEVRSGGSVQADIISTGSTVILNGSANQTITSSGSRFNNLILNNTGPATITLGDALEINSDLTITSGTLDTTSANNHSITVLGSFDQSSPSSQVEANSSTITVGGNFSANGTLDSTNYNNATLVMSGTGSLRYNNLTSHAANGLFNLTVGQSGNTTTLFNTMSVRNQLDVGSGSLVNNLFENLYLIGTPNPLNVDNSSIIDIFHLRFHYSGVQNLPTLLNGYDSTIKLSSNGTILNQTGPVTINADSNLTLDGDTFASRTVTYNTNGFDLTVGGNIQIGAGNDTAVKRFDITNSTVTVGRNIEVRSIGAGSVQAGIISTGSTVILNGSALQTVTMNSSDFNDLTVNNVSTSGVTFTDSFTTNNFTNTTPSSKMTFAAGQTYTINGAVTLQGASAQPLTLASSIPGTYWNFVLNSGATKAIDYVSVSWSDASGSHTTQNPILPTNSNNGGNNIDWFGTSISVNKASTLISDPINGTGAGKGHIPGAIVEYSITTINSGYSSPDTNSVTITDVFDSNVEYDVSGISFTAQNSGLILGAVTYSHRSTPTVYSYVPSGVYDSNVAGIKITTNGIFNHTDTPDPRFTVTYRVRIK